MFEEMRGEYASSSRSSCSSLNGSSSASSSFYSWDTACMTPPPSIRHASLDSFKFDDMSFCSVSSVDGYGMPSNVCSIGFGTTPGFSDSSVLLPEHKMFHGTRMADFDGYSAFNGDDFESVHSCHGLASATTPALEVDLSSPVSMNFVVPSQTTLADSYDVQSPMRPLQFHSPVSDYNSSFSLEHSPLQNVAYSTYEDSECSPSTPCRVSASRQPVFGPMKSSVALNKVLESTKSERRENKRAFRVKRETSCDRRSSRGILEFVQRASDKPCPHPGCTKKFKRQEHLKRHEKTHRSHAAATQHRVQCPICFHVFKGERVDNLKTHLEIHAGVGTSRTKHSDKAQPMLDEMERQTKKKGKVGSTNERIKTETPRRSRSRVNEY